MSLTTEEFRRLFGSFQQSVFRLQLLPEYRVRKERDDYAMFLDGEPLPDRSNTPWLETMAGQVARGRTWTNVHLLPDQLTPYLRYLIDWWYAYHARAGAEIRFLPSRHADEVRSLAQQDFWLFDDHLLVLMHNGPNGEFLGVEDTSSPDALAGARKARDFALAHAEDLRTLLARRRAGKLI